MKLKSYCAPDVLINESITVEHSSRKPAPPRIMSENGVYSQAVSSCSQILDSQSAQCTEMQVPPNAERARENNMDVLYERTSDFQTITPRHA